MKIFEGIVISVKMNNTAIVEVTRRTPHPLYRKLIKRSKKYKVDTAGQELTTGQTVKIVETRPMSKDKYFKVMENKKISAKSDVLVSTPVKRVVKASPRKIVAAKNPAKKLSRAKSASGGETK